MKLLRVILATAPAVLLTSCVLGGKANTVKTPPTPAPAVTAAKPAPPPGPISSPQTDVQLPPAQAVTPEALATIQNAPEVVVLEPAPPPPKPERKRAASPPPKVEPAAPPVVETPAPPPPEPQVQLQPVYSEEERRRILTEVERRKGEIAALLRGIARRRLSADERSRQDRIHSFVAVVDDAVKRGDLSSADSLSQRALILARELGSGR